MAKGKTTTDAAKADEAPKCPVTRKQFRDKAPAGIKITLDGKDQVALKKEFSTGSLGWFANEKITVEVDGVPCKVQVGINLTLVGSKELPKE